MPKFVNIEHYPELAEVNLDLAPKAMQEGYPGHRPLFKKDGEAQQILTPALEKLFAVGDTTVTYMKDIAQQVTAKMKGQGVARSQTSASHRDYGLLN
ncbi:MAG TPA: hypothetical protein VIL85_06435 [Thermomicrobiales bacterium]|jgi:hypothetical protein